MLHIMVAVMLAMPVHKALPMIGETGHSTTHKIAVADGDTISQLPADDGWRAYLMPEHKNIIAVSKDTLIAVWGPPSGDATYFFLGVKVGYSFDGGHTWSSYDLSTNFVRRIYPSSYLDRSTNTPWFVWQEIDTASVGRVYVGYDAAYPFGIMTTVELPNGGNTYWVPDIFAKGDTVLVVGVDFGNSNLGYWRSTDKGQTFTHDDSTLTNLLNGDFDTPFFLYDEANNRVYLATLNASDNGVALIWSDDMGATWNGPVTDTVPHGPYTEASWWYSYDGVIDNAGNVHLGVVVSPSGIENGILYDIKYDGTAFSSTIIAGDENYGDTTGFYHSARIPTMAKDADGNLYAIYYYSDTVTLNDTLYGYGDIAVSVSHDNGTTWNFAGYLDGTHDSPYTDMDEGRGEAARDIFVEGDNSYIHFVYAYDEDAYQTFFHYGNSVVGVTEKVNDNISNVSISNIAHSSLNIKLASNVSGNVEVRIYNVNGQLVRSVVTHAERMINVPVAGLSRGVYLVKVVAGNLKASGSVIVR